MFAITGIPTMGIVTRTTPSKTTIGRDSILRFSFELWRCEGYGHLIEVLIPMGSGRMTNV